MFVAIVSPSCDEESLWCKITIAKAVFPDYATNIWPSTRPLPSYFLLAFQNGSFRAGRSDAGKFGHSRPDTKLLAHCVDEVELSDSMRQ